MNTKKVTFDFEVQQFEAESCEALAKQIHEEARGVIQKIVASVITTPGTTDYSGFEKAREHLEARHDVTANVMRYNCVELFFSWGDGLRLLHETIHLDASCAFQLLAHFKGKLYFEH